MPLKPNRLKLVAVIEPQEALKSVRPVGTVVSAIKLLPRIRAILALNAPPPCSVAVLQVTVVLITFRVPPATLIMPLSAPMDILAEGALLDWGGIALVCYAAACCARPSSDSDLL